MAAASRNALAVTRARNRLGAANFRRSGNRAGRFILIGSAEQIELHPRDVVPAVVLPFDAAV